MYTRIGKQPSRLGSWEGFGTFGDDVAAIINAVNNGVVGVVSAVEQGETARALSRDKRDVAIATVQGQTQQVEIRAEAEVAESHDVVAITGIKYSGSTKIILALGISLAAVILVSGVSIGIAKKPKRKK